MFIDLKSFTKYIGRSDLAASYLEEIRKFPVLSANEEKQIFKEIKKGDIDARNKMIECNQRFVFAIAKRYATNEINLLDILNEGNIGLIKAIETFDESLGYKFTTYAVWFITREINIYLNSEEGLIQKSNHSKTNKKLQKIKNSFFLENGYNPSIDEICHILKEKYNYKVIDKRDLYELSIDSIDANINDNDDFTLNETYEYNAKSSNNNLYEETEKHEYEKVLVEELLHGLSEREELIIKLLYGINCDRSYEISEISNIVGLSTERIRQIRNSVINNLKRKAIEEKIAI